jgi:hypothetical protein
MATPEKATMAHVEQAAANEQKAGLEEKMAKLRTDDTVGLFEAGEIRLIPIPSDDPNGELRDEPPPYQLSQSNSRSS